MSDEACNLVLVDFKLQYSESELDKLSKSFFSRVIDSQVNDLYSDITFNDFKSVFAVAVHDVQNPSEGGKLRKDIGTRNGLARSLGCSGAKASRLLAVYKHVYEVFERSRDANV